MKLPSSSLPPEGNSWLGLVKGQTPSSGTEGCSGGGKGGRCLPRFLRRRRRDVNKVCQIKVLTWCIGEEITSPRRGHHGGWQIEVLALLRGCARRFHRSTAVFDCGRRRVGKIDQKVSALVAGGRRFAVRSRERGVAPCARGSARRGRLHVERVRRQ